MAAAAVFAAVVGCGAPVAVPAGACTPGAVVECPCPGGGPKGAQSCRDDGAGFAACACAQPQADAGSDTAATEADSGVAAADAGRADDGPASVGLVCGAARCASLETCCPGGGSGVPTCEVTACPSGAAAVACNGSADCPVSTRSACLGTIDVACDATGNKIGRLDSAKCVAPADLAGFGGPRCGMSAALHLCRSGAECSAGELCCPSKLGIGYCYAGSCPLG